MAIAGDDPQAPAGAAEADLAALIGPGARAFLAADRRRRAGRGRAVGWLWPALLGPIWLFYRRLYGLGLAALFAPFLAGYVVNLGWAWQAAVAVALALTMQRGYLRWARARLRAIDARGLDPAARAAALRAAGGVSPAGAAFGAILLLAGFAGGFIEGYLAAQRAGRLPACAAPEVVAVALGALGEDPARPGRRIRWEEIAGVAPAARTDARVERLCRGVARGEGGEMAIEYRMTWLDRAQGRFQLELRAR